MRRSLSKLSSTEPVLWQNSTEPCAARREVLFVVQPETVIRWHREGFRRYWRSISVPGPGRPPISEETKQLVHRIATENHWRARKIQAELSKLGIELSLATVSRYLPKTKPAPGSSQRWITFLRNHRDLISGMDFFVVPTVRFRLLYVWFAIDHGRRRILHFNVTGNPAARWVIQQLRNAFPDEPSHRFVIFDNDSIFSADVAPLAYGVRNPAPTNRLSKSMAKWDGRTLRRQCSPGASRSRRRAERRPPETAAS